MSRKQFATLRWRGSLVLALVGVCLCMAAGRASAHGHHGGAMMPLLATIADPRGADATDQVKAWVGVITALGGLLGILFEGVAKLLGQTRANEEIKRQNEELLQKLSEVQDENRRLSLDQIATTQSLRGDLSRPFVLLVEDDEASGTGLQVLLTRCGFRVDLATTALTAYAKLAQLPGWVVSDIALGGDSASGWDILREARRRNPAVRLACYTAMPNATPPDGLQIDLILTKPVNTMELVRAIQGTPGNVSIPPVVPAVAPLPEPAPIEPPRP